MSPERRYRLRTVIFMSAYVAFNLAAIFGAFDSRQPPGTWLLALAIAAPVVGQIWATLAFMRDSDEFIRALTARRFIMASGLAMAGFTTWGFLESYADAPHAPGWLIFALFWLCYGVVAPFVRSTR
jgi:putative oxidoreductase